MDGLGKIAQACALATMLMGVSVLAGWALEIGTLKGVLPGLATMKANTALCFTLAGLALALRARPRARVLCAAAVLAVGGLTLAQEVTGADFGIDQLLFRDASAAQAVAPGRMSPATAVSFLLSGAALLLAGARRTVARRASEALALGSGAMGSIAVLGYAYGVEQLYLLPGFTSVALHTATTFVVLAAGILCARPDGIVRVFASPGVGGQLARQLLPLALLLPAALGWLEVLGQRAGLFGPAQGTAVFASAMILALVALIWRNALSLEAADADRVRARQALEASRARLAGIVESAMDAVISVDAGQRIVLFNAAAERMFGCPAAAAIGSPIDRFIPWRFREAHVRHIANFARTGATSRAMGRLGSLRGLRSDGEDFPIEASISQVDIAGGKLFTVILRDITERLRAERALRQRTEELELAIAGSGGAQWEIDLDPEHPDRLPETMKISPQLKGILGFRDDELPNSSSAWCGRIHPDDVAALRPSARAQIKGDMPVPQVEYRIRHRDGSWRWIASRGRLFPDERGRLLRWAGIEWDITAAKQTEERIRSVALFPDENPHPVMRAAGDGTLLFANSAAVPLLEQWHCPVGARVPEAVGSALRRALETGERQELESRCGERDLSFVLVPIAERHYVNLYGRDITERMQAEEALRDYTERLQVLSRRLIEIQEAERRAIARELHDEIGQVLTAVKIRLQAAGRRPGTGAPDLKDSVEIVEDAIQRVRNRSLDLRPSLLDDLGLVPTIRWYLERHASLVGLSAELVADPLLPRPPAEVETSCFRVVQEAVTNAMRHARAKILHIELRKHAGRLDLSIRDDGVGFDVKAARRRAQEGGSIGLLGMEERVELLGGDFEIESAPGRGTLICVSLPLPDDLTGPRGGEPP